MHRMTSALHHAGAPAANHPSQQESILKPAGWMNYRYPFIYGQPDTRQFPLATWRSAANWLHGGVRDPAGSSIISTRTCRC
jgi:GntR family transcriptional regulator/MocR family aminotransferase